MDAPLPRPRALRCHPEGARPSRPPLGVDAWSAADDRDAAIVVAIAPAEDVASIARQLPDPGALAPGTLVFVPASPLDGGVLGRLFKKRVPRALRATALLARGYVGIAAAVDGTGADLVWGRAARDA